MNGETQPKGRGMQKKILVIALAGAAIVALALGEIVRRPDDDAAGGPEGDLHGVGQRVYTLQDGVARLLTILDLLGSHRVFLLWQEFVFGIRYED